MTFIIIFMPVGSHAHYTALADSLCKLLDMNMIIKVLTAVTLE